MKTIEELSKIFANKCPYGVWRDDAELAFIEGAKQSQRWIPKTEDAFPIGIDIILMLEHNGKRQYYLTKFESAMDVMLWMEKSNYTHWRPIELT